MSRFFLLTFCLTLFNVHLFSQENTEDKSSHFTLKVKETNEEKKKKINFKDFSFKKIFINTDFNILIGATQFYGDIKQWDHIPAYEKNNNFFELKGALELSFTKEINRLFSIQTTAIIGQFGGLRRDAEYRQNEIFDPYGFYQGTGEYFVCDFTEFDLQALLNMSNILSLFNTGGVNNYTIYAKGGIGYNIFNTVNRNLESGDYIYSYGYEDESQNGGLIKKSLLESPAETVYIYGLVFDYEITEKVSLLLDFTKRIGKTDKWDASISNFSNVVASRYDNFNFYSVGMAYNIGGKLEQKKWKTPLEGL